MQLDRGEVRNSLDGAIEPTQFDSGIGGLFQQILKFSGDSGFSIVHDRNLPNWIPVYLAKTRHRILPAKLQILLLTFFETSTRRKS
jgi:hypothetical protein